MDLELVGCSLLKGRDPSGHEIAHAQTRELTREIERPATDKVGLLIHAAVGCTNAESELMVPPDRGHVVIELILRWDPVGPARHLYGQARNSTGYRQIRNPVWSVATINVRRSCVANRKILFVVLMVTDTVDSKPERLNSVGADQIRITKSER